jgi:putative ABC transport system permease protein
MLKNYLKITLRNLRRNKAYSFLNIFGLAIGIACCLLILLFIQDELSYDKFNKNADRIYRINSDVKFGSREMDVPLTSDMMGQTLKKDYPQVEEYTRIYTFVSTKQVKNNNIYNDETNIVYADSTFFKIFTFPAISGNTLTALEEPNSVVITETIAKKYFGRTDVVGEVLNTKDNGGKSYKITAVIKDMPENSHFRFNFIFPMSNLNYDWGNFINYNFYTYLLLRKGTNYKDFENKFVDYNDRYVFPFAMKFIHLKSKEDFEKAGNKIVNSLIPLTDIHLYSTRPYELSPSGTIEYVYILSAVALFILLIACINFMNLTTARSANRAREVGIRKVLGTERKKLIAQFLTESIMAVFFSVLFSLFIVYDALPLFNHLTGKELEFSGLFTAYLLPVLITLPFIVGFLAGAYPSFYLSKFNPIQILKTKLYSGHKGGALRSTLVVFQFVTSIALIICTLVIYSQLKYMQNKSLGYQREHVLIINNFYSLGNNMQAFKDEMLNTPGVVSATISGFLPTPSIRNNNSFFKEATLDSRSAFVMADWAVDYKYLETMGMHLIRGRNFSREFGTDSSAIILNEVAAKMLGYKDPLNRNIYTLSNAGKPVVYHIIGIVKNFNFESLRNEIGPLCFVLGNNSMMCSFKINTYKISGIVKQAESKWKTLAPEMPFNYRFMDDAFNDMYKSEQRFGTTALVFSIITILVACLGLFGLAAFLAEQRTKEIGIRKVLGASTSSLMFMLSREFLKWIIISNIIAWPLAYYFMNKWLEDFAYRINMNVWIFILSGSVALLIALATISFQAIKAAIANPVESLRYE